MADSSIHYPNQSPKEKPSKTPIIIGAAIIIALVVGIFILRQPKKSENVKESTSTTENKQPTPTEEPEVDKEKVKIQVVNGTGTPGQAGKVVDILKEAGYSNENIETDNADEFATTTTTISAKEGYNKIANDIKDELEATFDEIEIDTSLEDDSDYDIVITTGGKKYEEKEEDEVPTPTEGETSETPTPTATHTPTPTPTP